MTYEARTGAIPTYPDFADKVAVVTGGSRDIGAATCRLLAANSARVAVNGRDETALHTAVGGIRDDGGRAIGVGADVTDFGAIEDMRRWVEQELGPVEVLVAFAGGQGQHTPTEQITEEQWRSVVDANLTAHVPDCEELLARHDRASPRLDHHHGFQRGPPPVWRLGVLRRG